MAEESSSSRQPGGGQLQPTRLELATEEPQQPKEPGEPSYLSDRGPGDTARASLSFITTVLWAGGLTFVIGVTAWFSYVFGFTIYESYFKIPEEVEVPVLTGSEVRRAYDNLEQLGLKLQVHESRHSKDVPREVILSQSPAPGRKVRKNRAILVVVSLGPELIEVPDLGGKTLREARIVLSNNRLRVGNVSFKEPMQGKPEQVINQRPAAGEMVRKGEAVNLQIQKGGGAALIDVPNWQGVHVDQVQEVVGQSDLHLGSVNWVFSEFVPKGEVVGQVPSGGGKVSPRTPVDFEVSAGPTRGRLFKQRRVSIEVPAGSRSQRVAVVVNSDVGADTIFQGSHLAGDEMELLVAGWPGSEIEVYINDRLQRREKL
ncbi:MAG: PASTA domain-containing protein [Armatimonadetes bacterium]|nr:PASTA domain-containing protein [Armatimonadota bacterium]